MAWVYVSIGSNIDAERHIRLAVRDLRREYGPLTISPVYRSESVGFDGDDFLNLVVGFDTALEPVELADALRAMEARHGRVRGGSKFSARTLDLDILTYDDLVFSEGRLSLPRDEITRYAFVLGPLADIAGGRSHPVLGQTYADLWAAFDASGQPMERVELELESDA
ncbi:MAG: 2-amino-4-hydroxy-6-hydroxymethyldihydropteridine diphosphokinase [Ectothiorhodospiraceae bacterium]|nr:2-amino-4-hydroxy-6-hydroxymethyldihydropteridine diphosphokinase [Ectothiorhodospiraceae bacterium]MCH8504201.1 2-amino-4-hydroxy-6-hydroxymethyldihydropteridine diphosphokinase [Ectothiorhodospiraceae bacterium]